MPQLEVNDLAIEYDTFGEAEADPVLLIMGLGTQMIAWSQEFCDALAAHGHYVIRFDNRDIGLSTKFDGVRPPGPLRFMLNQMFRVPVGAPYSLDDMAADAAGLLEALDIESAHIVGASMGGMIAQLVAVNHASKVKSLTSLMSSSGARGLPKPRWKVQQHIFFRRPDGVDRQALLQHSIEGLKLISSPAFPRSEREWRILLSLSMERSYNPVGFLRQLAAIADDGSRVDRLKTIDCPTLVIHGRDDPLVPVECGIDTAHHVRGSKLEIIDGMGHDIPPQLIDTLTTMIADHARQSMQTHLPPTRN